MDFPEIQWVQFMQQSPIYAMFTFVIVQLHKLRKHEQESCRDAIDRLERTVEKQDNRINDLEQKLDKYIGV